MVFFGLFFVFLNTLIIQRFISLITWSVVSVFGQSKVVKDQNISPSGIPYNLFKNQKKKIYVVSIYLISHKNY